MGRPSKVTRGPCIPWTGYVTREGYPQMSQGRAVHRLVYKLAVGPIPFGFDVDHTCHNEDISCVGGHGCPHRRCVNPVHLEAVSRGENLRRSFVVRKPLCPQGHPYDMFEGNKRRCRTCRQEKNRRYLLAHNDERNARRREARRRGKAV